MRRTIYNTATSLDGFIADQDHSLEYLFTADREGREEAGDGEKPGASEAEQEIDTFMAQAGTVVMGATTYEWLHREMPDEPWPYSIPSWVLTHRELPRFDGDIRFASADTDQELRDLHKEWVKAADGRNVWLVGGGNLAADLARIDLLDEAVATIAPVTLGAGAPLMDGRVKLKLLDVHRTGPFASTHYEVVKA
ncbi:dihydrofolate reductase family protein [Nocardiopsis oceani]